MKKIIVTLLAAAMLISCVCVLASCGGQGSKPELDLEDAAENLEDEDYIVEYEDDEDNLSANVAEKLTARNSDGDYIYITVYKDSKSASMAFDELKLKFDYQVKYAKAELKKMKHMVKKYEDDVSYDEDDIEDFEEEFKEGKAEYCYGKSGKIVWEGTKNAVKDSKG